MVTLAATTVVLREKLLYLVQRKGTGKWQMHCKLEGQNKWHRQTTGTADLAKATAFAEDFRADARAAERRGFTVVSKKFSAVANLVCKRIEQQIQDKTVKPLHKQYPNIIKTYLIPFFGNYKIDTIDKKLITKFLKWRKEELGKNLKKSTQDTHNMVLTMIFEEAVDIGSLTSFNRRILQNDGDEGDVRGYFTYAEFEKLLEFLKNWAENARDKRSKQLRELLIFYVAFVAYTGTRPGTELEELKWKQIQRIDNEYLQISLTRGKTGGRQLVARNELWTVLERIKQLDSELDKYTIDEILDKKIDKYVFRMRNGKRPYSFTNSFADALKDANMVTNGHDEHKRSLYSLRHHYATKRVEDGLTFEVLEKQMGTSSKMLSKHYYHFNTSTNAKILAGGERGEYTDALKFVQPVRQEVLNMLGIATGIYLTLHEQNYTATQELKDELKAQSVKSK